MRIGLLSCAHVHTASYVRCFLALGHEIVLADDREEAKSFAAQQKIALNSDVDEVIAAADAVVITSENTRHAALAERAFAARKPVLCEKPLATTIADAERMIDGARSAGVVLMTAFPCPFSPAFAKAKARVDRGEIGRVLAVNATNHGTCPFGWFVDADLSGGGAMIDHVVHVADLLLRLLDAEPTAVTAMTGHQMYQEAWDDSALLQLDYADGRFATIDSSWSRLPTYKTWGDVHLTLVGERGVIECDLFGAQLDLFASGAPSHRALGYGSDLDLAMCTEFLSAIHENRAPLVTGEHGLAALRVALSGYASLPAAVA